MISSFLPKCIVQFRLQHWALAPLLLLIVSLGNDTIVEAVSAQTASAASRALTLRSDVQEANAKTGVVTARGNVQINYPSRQIQATAAQAQYFSRERRIVLSGNVYVLQEGNSMRGETITYLIDEGRFVALPEPPKQVESIYLVPENSPLAPTSAETPSPFGAQPEFSPPASDSVPPQLLINTPGSTTPLPPGQR